MEKGIELSTLVIEYNSLIHGNQNLMPEFPLNSNLWEIRVNLIKQAHSVYSYKHRNIKCFLGFRVRRRGEREMRFQDLAINTLDKSENVRKPQTHAFPYKGLSSYQHLSANKITDKPQMKIPPFHSCTISCVLTILLLSFLWYVFYGGGDTHTGTSGHAKRKRRKEGERERILVLESLYAILVPSQE